MECILAPANFIPNLETVDVSRASAECLACFLRPSTSTKKPGMQGCGVVQDKEKL